MTSADTHPAWCSPRLCSADAPDLAPNGGDHRSEPRELDMRLVFTNVGPVEAMIARLTQSSCSWKPEPYLRLVTGGGVETDLPISQAAGVLLQLTELVSTDS